MFIMINVIDSREFIHFPGRLLCAALLADAADLNVQVEAEILVHDPYFVMFQQTCLEFTNLESCATVQTLRE